MAKSQLTNHGGSSSQSGFSSLVEVINGYGTHEGHLHMGVRINPTWDYQHALSIDDLRTARCDQVLAHLSRLEANTQT